MVLVVLAMVVLLVVVLAVVVMMVVVLIDTAVVAVAPDDPVGGLDVKLLRVLKVDIGLVAGAAVHVASVAVGACVFAKGEALSWELTWDETRLLLAGAVVVGLVGDKSEITVYNVGDDCGGALVSSLKEYRRPGKGRRGKPTVVPEVRRERVCSCGGRAAESVHGDGSADRVRSQNDGGMRAAFGVGVEMLAQEWDCVGNILRA